MKSDQMIADKSSIRKSPNSSKNNTKELEVYLI